MRGYGVAGVWVVGMGGGGGHALPWEELGVVAEMDLWFIDLNDASQDAFTREYECQSDAFCVAPKTYLCEHEEENNWAYFQALSLSLLQSSSVNTTSIWHNG